MITYRSWTLGRALEFEFQFEIDLFWALFYHFKLESKLTNFELKQLNHIDHLDANRRAKNSSLIVNYDIPLLCRFWNWAFIVITMNKSYKWAVFQYIRQKSNTWNMFHIFIGYNSSRSEICIRTYKFYIEVTTVILRNK